MTERGYTFGGSLNPNLVKLWTRKKGGGGAARGHLGDRTAGEPGGAPTVASSPRDAVVEGSTRDSGGGGCTLGGKAISEAATRVDGKRVMAAGLRENEATAQPRRRPYSSSCSYSLSSSSI